MARIYFENVPFVPTFKTLSPNNFKMSLINFQYLEDLHFFCEFLDVDESGIDKYRTLFDFNNPVTKRTEFNKIRNTVLAKLKMKFGETCELHYPGICDVNSGFNVDHIIPLSTNKLNKELRKLQPVKGKKVETQSFGSNSLANLSLTCARCNSFKKHRFLDKKTILTLLEKRMEYFSF